MKRSFTWVLLAGLTRVEVMEPKTDNGVPNPTSSAHPPGGSAASKL